MIGSRSHLALPNGIFLLLVTTVLLSAAGPCSKELAGPVAPSQWGGDHLGLTVTATGGSLEYDCAAGSIDQPIVAGTDGNFVALGTHSPGHGGPIMQGEVPERRPARYDGWTDGETMTLKVTLTDTNETLGTFRLARGQTPHILRCL